MFSAIGRFVGRVFGSQENIGKTADMIRDGVDKLVFTDEEKADYSQKSVELYIEFLRVQTDGGHLARRLLALMVGFAWTATVALLVLGVVLSAWLPVWAGIVGNLFEVLKGVVAMPFLAVMTFYFGHRILQGARDK